jgi:hypothetical protein
MKKLLISAAVGAAALFASNAQAADVFSSTTQFYTDEAPVYAHEAPAYAHEAPVVESVRMVCNEYGRCWREPSRRTVIIERDSYNYAPRERYIERRHYDDRPGAGVGIRAPGVSVGVGVGGDRW